MDTPDAYKLMIALAGLLLGVSLVSCGDDGGTQPTSDSTPPAKISDFRIDSIQQSTVWLAWTATGDDNDQGTAAAYDLRYSDDSMVLKVSWNSARTVLSLPAPEAAGTPETFVLTDLPPDTTFYLAIKARDEAGNASAISSTVSAYWVSPIELTLQDLQVTECREIELPLLAHHASNIAGVEIHIQYNPQQMTYDSVTSEYLNNMITNADDSLVHIIWADIGNLVTVPNGEPLVVIHFSNLTGTSQLVFDPETQVVDYNGNPVTLVLTNGSVECTGK